MIAFLFGIGLGYLVWGRTPSGVPPEPEQPAGSADTSKESWARSLASQVNPPGGYTLPATYGDLGPQLIAMGAIDEGRFRVAFERAGQPLTEEQLEVLREGSLAPITIDPGNARFLLNLFWAVGLANHNPLLEEGPMVQYGQGEIGRFASTGGWTLGQKPATELYSAAALIPLTDGQQARVEEVAPAVYRPCCNNPTHFPDCNHGMAMLGLLELMASQGASSAQMFEAAKYLNAFWFPQQTLEVAAFFHLTQGQEFTAVDSQQIVGAQFSSGSGFQAVHQWWSENGGLEGAPSGGSGCGV